MAAVDCALLAAYAQERVGDPQNRYIILEAIAVLHDLGSSENATMLEHRTGLLGGNGEQAPGSPAGAGSAMGAPGADSSTSAQLGSPTQSVWQWQDPDSSRWEAFDSSAESHLEQCYVGGKRCLFCKIDGEDYCMDFVSWQQTGLRSGMACRIRRVPALTGAETAQLLGLQGGSGSGATSPEPIHSPLNYSPAGPPTESSNSSSDTPSGGNDSPQGAAFNVQLFMLQLNLQQWQQPQQQMMLLFPPLPAALGGAAAQQPAPALPQPQPPAAPPPPPLQPQPPPLQPQPPPLQPQPPPLQPQPLQPPPPPPPPVPQEMDQAPGQDAGPAAGEEDHVPPQAAEDDADSSSGSPIFLYPLLYPPNFDDLQEPLLNGSQEAAPPREGAPGGEREPAHWVEYPPGPQCCWDRLATPCWYCMFVCCWGCGRCPPEEEEE